MKSALKVAIREIIQAANNNIQPDLDVLVFALSSELIAVKSSVCSFFLLTTLPVCAFQTWPYCERERNEHTKLDTGD